MDQGFGGFKEYTIIGRDEVHVVQQGQYRDPLPGLQMSVQYDIKALRTCPASHRTT